MQSSHQGQGQNQGEIAGVPSAWHTLPDEVQLTLSREALRRAAETLADHAELLASEMEIGTLLDQGGPEALRLFAAVIRATNRDGFATVGSA
ncbi:hypothetical protein J8J14_09385 [Roseomonas sp. SSH11]|uniref:Uncharacterized protein n=1 Tax=Pararoseomonas baculiformis TaxID=2820812 RepID=A0ABS4ADA7_9PROT|nr:hypothetical protein [Pararoseomonas baculiformis]MBP0444993.1 hypothetical protein [Pararoseomonas baculiformis]